MDQITRLFIAMPPAAKPRAVLKRIFRGDSEHASEPWAGLPEASCDSMVKRPKHQQRVGHCRVPLRVVASVLCGLTAGTASVRAQATVIDGTSGSNIDASVYSTTGNLDLSLGFFAEYLIVGGGGGGGGSTSGGLGGGGGGAGGYLSGSGFEVAQGSNYPVTVGGGGAAGSGAGVQGTNGDDSVFATLTALGGGGGGGANGLGSATAGRTGGSGIVVVRYQGAPAATGGDRTEGTGDAAGYTVH